MTASLPEILATVAICLPFFAAAQPHAGTVVAWGQNLAGQTTVPTNLAGVIAISAAGDHNLALNQDGTIVAWGGNEYGVTNVLGDLSNVVAVAAGFYHNLALKRDGTVIAWGAGEPGQVGVNHYGQSTVPGGLASVVAIAAGGWHSLALKNDGTVLGWGRNDDLCGRYAGQASVPAGLTGVIAVAAGYYHSLALKGDGTVIAWGAGARPPTNGCDSVQALVPGGLSGVIGIAASSYYSLALKRDATVVAWGNNEYGQTNVPAGLNQVAALAPGFGHCLALKHDGTLAAWGDNSFGQVSGADGLSGIIALAAGQWHNLALVCPSAYMPSIIVPPQTQTAEIGATVGFSVVAGGLAPLNYQWFFNGTNLFTEGTNASLAIPEVQPSHAGSYAVTASNFYGSVTSAPALLNVIPSVSRRMVPGLTLFGQAGDSLNLDSSDSLGPSINWVPLATIGLTNSAQWYFDLAAPLPPQRFYRAWHTGTLSLPLALSLPGMVPAITLAGNIGDSLRLDYINQFGPIDAWMTLATITMADTSQLYFDTSVIGQPPRLYRIVPGP